MRRTGRQDPELRLAGQRLVEVLETLPPDCEYDDPMTDESVCLVHHSPIALPHVPELELAEELREACAWRVMAGIALGEWDRMVHRHAR